MSREMQFELYSQESGVSLQGTIPKHRLHQYQEQKSELDFVIQAKDGEVKFSRFISEFSGWFKSVCDSRESFKEGPIHYDGSEGSTPFAVDTIKNFMDFGHGIKIGIELYSCLDLIRFIHYEDKAHDNDGFEGPLLESLTKALITNDLDDDTRLMICLVLSTFDNPSDVFEKAFTDSISFENIKQLAWNWKADKQHNKELVEFYAYANECEFEEAEQHLSAEILCYSKLTLSKHYEETDGKKVFLQLASSLDPKAKYKKGDKIAFIAPMIETEENGRTIRMIKCEDESVEVFMVTSDSKQVVGNYVKIIESDEAPIYKRLETPDYYMFKFNIDGTWHWCLNTSYSAYANPAVEDSSNQPPERIWTSNTRITRKYAEAIFEAK